MSEFWSESEPEPEPEPDPEPEYESEPERRQEAQAEPRTLELPTALAGLVRPADADEPEADADADAEDADGAAETADAAADGALDEFEGGIAELIAQAGDSGEPLGLEPADTGHSGVDTALARLAELDGVPAEEHAGVYEDVHERLQGILAALDRPPGPPAPAPYSADSARRS